MRPLQLPYPTFIPQRYEYSCTNWKKYLWPGPGERQSERVLQAFQAMIEDPSSAHDYLNDPEVGPILMRVHSILSQVAEQRTNPGTTEEDAM